MEVHLAIPPQDLLVGLDLPSQAKPKGIGLITSSITPAIPTPTPVATKTTPAASLPPPRVTRAVSKRVTVTSLPPPLTMASFALSEIERPLEATLKRRKKINTEVPLTVEPIQTVLPLPSSTLSIPFLRQGISISLCPGLTPYLPHLTLTSAQFTPSTILVAPSSLEKAPVVTSAVIAGASKEDTSSLSISYPPPPSSSSPFSFDLLVARTINTARDTSTPSPTPMQPPLPNLSVPSMSVEEMDIF
ncbi:mucin-2-like [Camellia sinensis]|uniref:mucin-2-like n=1 Tax=Camellia sinensis TaxID=4442 RepID=UPI001035BB78|nr:mucin-2-like [Camellia sinensis]